MIRRTRGRGRGGRGGRTLGSSSDIGLRDQPVGAGAHEVVDLDTELLGDSPGAGTDAASSRAPGGPGDPAGLGAGTAEEDSPVPGDPPVEEWRLVSGVRCGAGGGGAASSPGASMRAMTWRVWTSVPLAHGQVGQDAGRVGLDLHDALLGIDLEQWVTDGDLVALSLEPAHEDDLHAHLADLGHDDVAGHQAAPMSAADLVGDALGRGHDLGLEMGGEGDAVGRTGDRLDRPIEVLDGTVGDRGSDRPTPATQR